MSLHACKLFIEESCQWFKGNEASSRIGPLGSLLPLRLGFPPEFSEGSKVVPQDLSELNHLVVRNPELSQELCLAELVSPPPRCEKHAAAVTLQKVYKSYRTRRNLADCAVVVEELWWKALDFASLKRSSISFFNNDKPETAVSRWARARTRAAKVGKGLSKSDKAQKLALRHWLEAIDPRHRYGHNLHFYYDVWFKNESTQPFFYWLDVGDGKEVNIEKCPRRILQQQCIKYLGPKERGAYEVVIKEGRLVYKQSDLPLHTADGAKWIFVLSTYKALYVGQKKKGKFQHSSFLAGGAITAAGRLMVENGFLKAIWPYSGHYLPTEENFTEFIKFLEENNVDLTNVKRFSIDDGESSPSFKKLKNDSEFKLTLENNRARAAAGDLSDAEDTEDTEDDINELPQLEDDKETDVRKLPLIEFGEPIARKWTTGAGPRIGCVREYPSDLQCRALERANLSPRISSPLPWSKDPVPSPRPSPKVRLSPLLAYMGISTPKINLTLPMIKNK